MNPLPTNLRPFPPVSRPPVRLHIYFIAHEGAVHILMAFTMPVLILGGFFMEDFPARLPYTGIFRCAPFLPPSHQLFSHSSSIPHLFLAQRLLNYPEKAMSGVVLFGLASKKRSVRWRYSRISCTGGFEPCRRVRPLLSFFSIPHLSFSSSALSTPPNELMNE